MIKGGVREWDELRGKVVLEGEIKGRESGCIGAGQGPYKGGNGGGGEKWRCECGDGGKIVVMGKRGMKG